jgi:ankyrin repeat protein
LIKHLISVSPESLEHKSSEGFTPLQLAVFARRPELVSYLLSAGANQLHRDNMGRNMVHTIVCHKQGRARTDAEEFESLLSLFDREKVKEMMLERCTAAPGALTPLAYWMAGNNSIRCRSKDLVEVLTSHGGGQELEMINGEGDLPVHVVSYLFSYVLTLLSFPGD